MTYELSHYIGMATALLQLKGDIIEYLAVVFILNAVSTTIGNLKSVFLNKKLVKPLYITTFIDAMVCAYALRLLASSSSLSCVVVFALGRIFGVWLGNRIEERLALGITELSIYKHPEDGALLADRLREQGFSVTTFLGYGAAGKERLVISVVVPRKQLAELNELLKEEGRLNMAVKDVSKTYGKVGSFQQNTVWNH